MKNVKRKIELGYNKREKTVISYWKTISWSKFNTMRLEQSYESKKDAVKRVAEKLIKKKKHGIEENLAVDQIKLLEEAKSWSADQKNNWSQLA